MSWILPPHIDEVTPEHAWQLETLRRRLLDLYRTWGYDFVAPSIVEHLGSLLSGYGDELEAQTVTFTDPASGQLLGIRADITPQAARTDSTFFGSDKITRISYLGNTLRAKPDGLGESRNPIQFGVELFGHDGLESDEEIVTLALHTLKAAGVTEPVVTLSHHGLLQHLLSAADFEQEELISKALAAKAPGTVARAVDGLPSDAAAQIMALVDLYGPADEVLSRARDVLELDEYVEAALNYLVELQARLSSQHDVDFQVDLAEVSGYTYETGLAFSIVAPAHDKELIRGGRYVVLGDEPEQDRPATGFSGDLKALLTIDEIQPEVILAPDDGDTALRAKVMELRVEGKRVVNCLSDDMAESAQATHKLVQAPSGWEVTPL